MKPRKPPRSIFKSRRRRGPVLFLGTQPDAPYLNPVLDAVRHLDPHAIDRVQIAHATDCPLPSGTGRCTCSPDELEVSVVHKVPIESN